MPLTSTRPAPVRQANEASIILKGRRVRRRDVLETIRECERVGRATFLDRHGYQDATRYHLRHDGRSYPTKAILGVAAGPPANWRGLDSSFGTPKPASCLIPDSTGCAWPAARTLPNGLGPSSL